ncbi:response regulator transcription factor [Roseateles sp. GG27B]
MEFDDYEIHEAVDGETGLLAAQHLRPDFVLLDVMMPGALDGLMVCRRIKAEMPTVHVLMLSARGHWQDRDEGLRAGADVYLVKPFSLLQLTNSVAALWMGH